jgi:hypothetical protein
MTETASYVRSTSSGRSERLTHFSVGHLAPSGEPDGATAFTPLTLFVLCAGFVLLLSQAFIPLERLVHRHDDAYYYFKVAATYPALGFWSFDGLQPTNGVQPLWAILLTGLAQVAAWFGVTDPHVLDRLFVAFAAVVQFAAGATLLHLVARQVSIGTGVAAAGAFFLPASLVWGRVSGVESPLLALMLVSTVAYYHLGFRTAPTAGRAAALGLLLGLTTLSRLNAGLLIPCLLGFHLLRPSAGHLTARFRHVLAAGATATAVVAPYLIWNLVQTGHLLPVSGVAKSLQVESALSEWAAQSQSSWKFLSFVYWTWIERVQWFIGSRLADGMWLTGVRLVEDEALPGRWLLGVTGALLLAPLLVGRPREWFGFLRERVRRLSPFAYFLAFALLDAVASVSLYPTQTYSIPAWWLVSDEILLIVLGATLTAASLQFIGAALLAPRRRLVVASAGLALLVAGHAWQSVALFWRGPLEPRDWHLSWNDESYRATEWINANVQPGARVGSWNAGVLGYYARRPVVNLDGLMNTFELLPYVREGRVHEYVLRHDIRYLVDMESIVQGRMRGRLALTEVHAHYSPVFNQSYRIYRVDGPAPGRSSRGER